jgi:DNA-directed RNA polymerase specialized sigma24 family protein
VKKGERERGRRLEELFGAYGADVVDYCSWRAGSASDAQDAVAEVFLTAWRGCRGKVESSASPAE